MTLQRAERKLEELQMYGFDLSRLTDAMTDDDPDGYGITPRCSACAVAVINGIPCHEAGCPNARHACIGCGELLPRSAGRYCADCR